MKEYDLNKGTFITWIDEQIKKYEKQITEINHESWGWCIQEAILKAKIEELNIMKYKTLANDFDF